MPRRCALGCEPSDVSMHRFPNALKFPEQLKAWVNLVGGKLETSSDFEYYKKQRICDIHFCDRYRNRNKRLSPLAIPTLHLTEQCQSQVILEQASTITNQPTIEQQNIPEPSTSPSVLDEELTSSQYEQQSVSQPVASGKSQRNAALKGLLEHDYSDFSKPRRTAGKDLSQLRKKIKHLQAEVIRQRKRNQSFKARLSGAEVLSSKRAMDYFAKILKKPAQLFLHMQLQGSKEPKGRRFTTEEKMLSLSLYKKSPKAYGLLNRLFTLPSIKCMKRLLNNVKIHQGIVPIVFERIEKTMSEKDDNDRLCSVVFEEMSLTPQVNYNAQQDVLEGLAINKYKNNADHVHPWSKELSKTLNSL